MYYSKEIQVWCACPVCHLPATKWETIYEDNWVAERQCTDCDTVWEIASDDKDIEVSN